MIKLTASQIHTIEADLNISLPILYRELLHDIGYGSLEDAEIYHPSEIEELYAPFFDNPDQLFNPYFPFGCHNTKQELWIIDAKRELAASIWHETVPDDWEDEEWLPFASWKALHLEQIDEAE